MTEGLFPPIVHGLASPDAPPGWPITVAMFWEMVRHGIIGEKDPVCLWRGRLCRRPLPVRRRAIAVMALYRHFLGIAPGAPHTESRPPVNLTREDSVLMPDASIIRGRMRDDLQEHPTPADDLLVAEVIDLPHERLPADVYAAEGIPVYWGISLTDRCVTVFHEPGGPSYSSGRVFGPDCGVPVVLDGRVVGRFPWPICCPEGKGRRPT